MMETWFLRLEESLLSLSLREKIIKLLWTERKDQECQRSEISPKRVIPLKYLFLQEMSLLTESLLPQVQNGRFRFRSRSVRMQGIKTITSLNSSFKRRIPLTTLLLEKKHFQKMSSRRKVKSRLLELGLVLKRANLIVILEFLLQILR